ncbi:MAG: TetR/AcrR family transcriptional regulator [Gemmatimonadota bacterium]|nr:MAG: TetR/AcrR family transcriptional regulator [Gemmatimonadota bacterium]
MTPKIVAPAQPSDTVTAIEEAARDLLAEGGLEALSMRGVAARVGVSATAIYNYFENKQALVKRVVSQGFERFTGYLRGAIVDLPVGSAERLKALGEAYIRFALENREYFRVIFASHAETPQDIEELPEGGGYELFRQTVVDAMEAGTIREADPDLVVLYLWTHVHGLVTLLLTCEPDARCEHTGKRLSAPELFTRFSEFVLYGLRPEGVSRAETGSVAAS